MPGDFRSVIYSPDVYAHAFAGSLTYVGREKISPGVLQLKFAPIRADYLSQE